MRYKKIYDLNMDKEMGSQKSIEGIGTKQIIKLTKPGQIQDVINDTAPPANDSSEISSSNDYCIFDEDEMDRNQFGWYDDSSSDDLIYDYCGNDNSPDIFVGNDDINNNELQQKF